MFIIKYTTETIIFLLYYKYMQVKKKIGKNYLMKKFINIQYKNYIKEKNCIQYFR